MKIVTENNAEIEELFYNSLCNAVSTGYMAGYGLELTYENEDYEEAKKSLKEKTSDTICFEDVLMEILKMGKPLTMKDVENDDAYTSKIYIKDLHKRFRKVPSSTLSNIMRQEDDVCDADVIIQTVFFKEVIFG
jgi:hypothetical protein